MIFEENGPIALEMRESSYYLKLAIGLPVRQEKSQKFVPIEDRNHLMIMDVLSMLL